MPQPTELRGLVNPFLNSKFQTLPKRKSSQTTISNLMKMEDDNFKFDENGRKFFITSNFSFSHSVFKRPVLQTCKNQGLFGKGLKGFFQGFQPFLLVGSLSHIDMKIFYLTRLTASADCKIILGHITTCISISNTVENIVKKGENAREHHFLLYSHMFSIKSLS